MAAVLDWRLPESPHPPTQGRFLGFLAFQQRSVIIPFGANIWRSRPN